MAYNPALLSEIDKARFVLGDIDTTLNLDQTTNELIPDTTYATLIGYYGLRAGIVAAAQHLIVAYSQYPDEVSESGGKSMKWTERVKAWEKVASGKFTIPAPLQPQRSASAIGLITAPDTDLLAQVAPGEFSG